MFLMSRRHQLVETGFFYGFTDFHNHILPGADEGIKSYKEALHIFEYFECLGVGKIVLTPRKMSGSVAEDEKIQNAYRKLCNAYRGNISLSLAAEYLLNSSLAEQIKMGLHVLDGNKVLIKVSHFSYQNELDKILFEIGLWGYTAVVVHPERYTFLNKTELEELKDKGCLLLLNLLSLSGFYGETVKRNAEFLLESGLYDISGTDIHNLIVFKYAINQMKITEKQLIALLKLIH